MEGQIGCKVYFIYASVYNIVSGVLGLLLKLVARTDDGDDDSGDDDSGDDDCMQAALQGSEIDQDALEAVQTVFVICGIIVYSLGLFGVLKKNKKALQCYIAGMIVITIVHVSYLLIGIVTITSGGIDTHGYTECFKKKVNNFYENDTTSSTFHLVDDCCYPGGDIVEFWKSINWHRDPNLPDTGTTSNVEVPKQCCEKNHPECRLKDGGDQYRKDAICLGLAQFGQTMMITFGVVGMLTWGIVLSLDVFLMYCVIRWLKSKPDVQPAQPTYELQAQTHQTYQPAAYQAQGQTPPPYQPAYQGAQGQTQPAYQQPGYQPPYQSPGQPQPTYQAQGQTQPAYQQPGYQPPYQSQGQPQPTYQAQGETDPAYQPPQPYQGYQPPQAYKPPQA